MIKRLRIPSILTFPAQITECHVAEGAYVAKGERIYTIEDSAGRKGFIRAPFSGHLAEGLVPVGAAFNGPVLIAGLTPAPEATHTPEAKSTKTTECPPSTNQKPTPPPPSSMTEDTKEKPAQPLIKDEKLLEKHFKAFLVAHDKFALTQPLETYRAGFESGLIAWGHAPNLVADKIRDRRLEARWNKLNAPSGGFFVKLLGMLAVLLALTGLFWVLVELRLTWDDGRQLIMPATIVAGTAGTLFLMFFAPARLVHGGTIILWVGASSAMALFLMQAELATLDKLHDYSKLNEMLGSIRIPGFSNPVISIAEELDLPEISRFSNGRVPQPTAGQQMEFERLILQ